MLRTIAKKQDNDVSEQEEVVEEPDQVTVLHNTILELKSQVEAQNMQLEKLKEQQGKGNSHHQCELFSNIDGPTTVQSKKSSDTVTERDEIAESVHSEDLQLQKSIENIS